MSYRHPLAWLCAITAILVCTNLATAGDNISRVETPQDEFPTGNMTPEGAATDLVRACIQRDESLFNKARHVRICEGKNDPAYYFKLFLKNASFTHGSRTFNPETLPHPLTGISKVYVSRSLAPKEDDEQAKWKLGLSLNFLEDRVFVDVVAVDSEGTDYIHRSIVEKHQGGNWHAVPPLSERHRMDEVLKTYPASTVEISKAVKRDEQAAK